MPLSPGWSFRASSTDTGTTSLSLALPSGTEDGDILIMTLAHKGAGYATMPAGWTLVAQEVSSGIRGEMYWRRAASETGPYSITDLADCAVGALRAYPGGLASGDVVIASVAEANASGDEETATGITTTVDHALIVGMSAVAQNLVVTSMGTIADDGEAYDLTDPDLASMNRDHNIGNTSGTDCRLCVADGIKVVSGPTGRFRAPLLSVEAANVMIVAAFLPDTTTSTSGSRYYFTSKSPGALFLGRVAGDWADSDYGIGEPYDQRVRRLSQLKAGGGERRVISTAINQQGNYDFLWERFVTPPLAAQTLSGTVDLTLGTLARWISSGGPTADTVARIKLHIYVTQGQTPSVRTTVLNQYVDATNLDTSTQTWRALTSPQSLTGASIQAGDSLMVEVGVRIVSSPTPTPTYPPTEYSQVDMVGFGTGPTVSGVKSDVPMHEDAADAETSLVQVGHLDFTHTVVEQAAPAAPSNDACAAPTSITTLPFTDTGYDTTGSLQAGRAVWYSFTAPLTAEYIFHAQGNNFQYQVEIDVFTGTCGALTPAVLVQNLDEANAIILAATVGTTYLLRVRTRLGDWSAPSSGGWLTFHACQRLTTPKEDDLFLVGPALVSVYRDGQLINYTAAFASSDLTTGTAIDYSGVEIDNLNGGTHDGPRLLVGLFSSNLVEIVDLGTLNASEFEIDFYGLNGWDDNARVAALAATRAGRVHVSWSGNGYLYVAGIGVLPAYLNALSSPEERAFVRSFNAYEGDNQPSPDVPAGTSEVPVGDVPPVYIDLDPSNEQVLYYTTTATYFPIGDQIIRRYNMEANTPMADFATVPIRAGAYGGLRGLCVLTNNQGVLVCNGTHVERLNASGAVVQSYQPSDANLSKRLADVKITADGAHFWVADGDSGYLWKFNLVSGVQEQQVQGFNLGAYQMVLYHPDVILSPIITPDFQVEAVNIRRLRQAPHLSNEQRRMQYSRFQIDVQAGVWPTSGQGSAPVIYLSWSDDGGHRFSNEYPVTLGPTAHYKQRAIWRRLGQSRDRIFRVVVSDPCDFVLLDAFLDIIQGSS